MSKETGSISSSGEPFNLNIKRSSPNLTKTFEELKEDDIHKPMVRVSPVTAEQLDNIAEGVDADEE